jgi:hypothetical protein
MANQRISNGAKIHTKRRRSVQAGKIEKPINYSQDKKEFDLENSEDENYHSNI